ncbi:ABC transporter permease [Bacteroidota bacterium]
MFKYNLKLIFRNLIRFKLYSGINILGLSAGIACVILIYLWVQDELSFDSFHKNYESVYRVVQTQYYTGGDKFEVDVTQLGMAPYVKEKIPGIIHSTRFTGWGTDYLIRYEDKKFIENIHMADPDFLEIFSFPLIKGDKETALKGPFSIVMTEEMAQKIFGPDDPINKTLLLNNKYDFIVTGIISKPPKNSHIQFDYLIPAIFYKELGRDLDDFGTNFLYTYVQLNENVDIENIGNIITDYLCKDEEDENGKCTNYYLQALKRIHLYPVWGGGPMKTIRIFSLIAILILIIACINFVNLSIALASRRFKETGLKKMVGAQKMKLIMQYYFEVFVLVLIALFVALIFVESLLPAFNELTGKEIDLQLFRNRELLVGLIGTIIITVLFAGTYPAIFISSPSPARVIKGDIYFGKKRSVFKQSLIILQFCISLILIINTILINKQLVFMQNRELGIEKENILCIPFRGELRNNYQVFKNELLQHKDILNVTFSSHKPMATYSNSGGWSWPGKSPEVDPLVTNTSIDFDYAETFGLQLKEGEFFPKKSYEDSNSAVINETFAKITGIEPVIGETFTVWDYTFKVAGVVEDYNFKPVYSKIEPIALFVDSRWYEYAFIKINSTEINNTIKDIEEIHSNFNSAYPFEYNFLDEDYNNLYWGEKQRRKIFSYFAFLSVFISCLGLFGLSSFILNQRTKEIGIRKANGAKTSEIILKLSKEFTIWIVISYIIACPVAYYFMHKWLQNFAYRTNISIWVFVIAGILSLIIALLTVSWQSWKAANKNPIEALRYE